MLPWNIMLPYWINEPVGVALVNGEHTSGKLCRFDGRGIYLFEFVGQAQYTTRFYLYGQIQNMTPFPSCFPIPTPY